MRLAAFVFASLTGLAAGHAFATDAPVIARCPALVNSQRPVLKDPLVAEADLHLDRSIEVPTELARTAADIVGKFESGGSDPWVGVSGQERVSIGFMQWNWITGSLVGTLIKSIPRAELELAPVRLQPDLLTLKALADSNTSIHRRAADRVIDDWTSARSNDPLRRGVRQSVTDDLRLWLGKEEIKKRQVALVDQDMRHAYALARAWRSSSGSTKAVDARLLANFFDLVTFNGGTAKIWVPHVKEFRSRYSDKVAVVHGVTDWLRTCNDTFVPTAQNKRMYNRADGVKSADYWAAMVDANPDAIDDDQVDLLVFGLLRAQGSIGDDPPKGFRGIYQADVLTRRGVIAVGSGYIRGSAEPVHVF